MQSELEHEQLLEREPLARRLGLTARSGTVHGRECVGPQRQPLLPPQPGRSGSGRKRTSGSAASTSARSR